MRFLPHILLPIMAITERIAAAPKGKDRNICLPSVQFDRNSSGFHELAIVVDLRQEMRGPDEL